MSRIAADFLGAKDRAKYSNGENLSDLDYDRRSNQSAILNW